MFGVKAYVRDVTENIRYVALYITTRLGNLNPRVKLVIPATL